MEQHVSRELMMDTFQMTCGTPSCALGEATRCPELAHQMPPLADLDLRNADIFFGGFALIDIPKDVFRLFGMGMDNAWGRGFVSPKEWAAEARKVLAEHGYSMDPKPDPFAAFMAKVREPVAVEA